MAGIQKVRFEAAARKKLDFQMRQERMQKARYLIFGKGNGRVKDLTPEEQKFVQSVWRESYQRYLLGNPRPANQMKHRRAWYGCMKTAWIRSDVPKMTIRQFDELEHARTNTAVPELH